MSTILAIDAATEACSVALLHQGRRYARYAVLPRQHARRLLPMVHEVLDEAGVSPRALDAIAFGRGPGAFTGVRIAVAVAQGLAFALQKPVLPVSDLAALAQRVVRAEGPSQVAAAIDARMGEVYWGCYALRQGQLCLLGEEAVLAPEDARLPADVGGDWYGAGTGWAYAERLPPSKLGRDAQLLPRAQDLLTLAVGAWERDEAMPVEQAQAVYLRDQVVTAPKRTSTD